MAYDYRSAVVSDLESMIRRKEGSILEHFEADSLEEIERSDLEEYVSEKGLENDLVTGNASGSYFSNFFEAGEALIGNDRLIAEALYVFGNEAKFCSGDEATNSTEYLDLIVRCYEVHRCVEEAVDNVINSPDKQIAEDEVLICREYAEPNYKYAVFNAVEDYIKENIADILKEKDINSAEEYSKEKSGVEDFVYEKIREGEVDIPLPNDSDIIHDIEKAFNNELLSGYDKTVADYFSNADVERTVKDCYAEKLAFKYISEVLDKSYEEVIEPVLNQKEEEQNIDRD